MNDTYVFTEIRKFVVDNFAFDFMGYYMRE